jgi:hypothetical protein
MRLRIRNVSQELEAQLQPTRVGTATIARSAHGKGEWKVYGDTTRQCKIWLSGLTLADGAVLQLLVSGRQITELMVQGCRAVYKRQSERGEAVSEVAAGQLLQVSYAGQIILEGEFYEQ